jgi:hypothetical protein
MTNQFMKNVIANAGVEGGRQVATKNDFANAAEVLVIRKKGEMKIVEVTEKNQDTFQELNTLYCEEKAEIPVGSHFVLSNSVGEAFYAVPGNKFGNLYEPHPEKKAVYIPKGIRLAIRFENPVATIQPWDGKASQNFSQANYVTMVPQIPFDGNNVAEVIEHAMAQQATSDEATYENIVAEFGDVNLVTETSFMTFDVLKTVTVVR